MKRILFVFIITAFCFTSNAQLKVKSGSNAFLNEQTTARLVLDYSQTTWEEDETYKHWCGEDYDERVELSKEIFTFAFNKYSKGLKINIDDNEDAKYLITFKIENMEQKVAGNFGQFLIRCYGLITIQEIATGETICVINVNRVEGPPDYVPNDRIAECFKEAGISLTFPLMTAVAKPDVAVIKGSLAELKKSNAKVFVRWDYTNGTINGKDAKVFLSKRGDSWSRDYNAEVASAENKFKDYINNESKDIQAINDENSAEYTIDMKVKDFQYGYPGTSLIIGAHLSGIMEIYKKGKTEPIAVIEVDAVPGAGADKEFRRDMAYKELADNLIRLIKKAK